MVVWHMLQEHGADFQLYQEKLTGIAPMLGQLANDSQVIWLNQYPTADYNGEIGNLKTDIHSEKIHHYNEAVLRILGSVIAATDIRLKVFYSFQFLQYIFKTFCI
jgi:hypothetical protein